jgi:signal transduction histidine kinase
MPTISVSTERLPDDRVEIRIRDNGTGMPESVRSKIFEPFFTTKPTGIGTGLGLSLSYDIVVKEHGGSLQVETTEGEGTEFIITLPMKREIATA